MFLRTPTSFPGGMFYIFGEPNEDNTHLSSLVECACRDTRCAGFVADIKAAYELPVLCREPNALSIELSLTDELRRNWYTLPVPHSDIWSYWEIAKELFQHIPAPGESPTLDLPRDGLFRFFANYRPGNFTLAHDQLTWNRGAYLSGIIDYSQRDISKVNFVLSSLSNWRSRRILHTVLTGSAPHTWDLFFSSLFSKVQYMSYISLRPGDVIINAGIHKGPEIPFLLNSIMGLGQIHNIDPLGFRFLSTYARTYCVNHPESIVEHEFALAAYDGTIALPIGGEHDQALGGLAGKSLQGFETRDFPCLKLSTLIKHLDLPRVDLLKFDLEGAETSILDDVIAVSKRFRPQIAISIYHSPTDYVEIPLRLMTELTNYEFYVEHYSFERYETVLYCIPRERDPSRYRELRLDVPVG